MSQEKNLMVQKKKLPELNILNLNDLSKKSHAQYLEIFDNKCTIKFHRMWLFISKNLQSKGTLSRGHSVQN